MEIGKIGKIENREGGIVNLGVIYGDVSTVVNQLPASPLSDQPGIKELLIQLQEAIGTESNLSNDDKAEALEQVKVLGEAGQEPNSESNKKIAKRATTMLRGVVTGLPDAAKLAEACSKLLPAVMTLFGL